MGEKSSVFEVWLCDFQAVSVTGLHFEYLRKLRIQKHGNIQGCVNLDESGLVGRINTSDYMPVIQVTYTYMLAAYIINIIIHKVYRDDFGQTTTG